MAQGDLPRAGMNIDLIEGLEEPRDLSAQLTAELVKGAAETGKPTGAVFRPTVLVGIGGTGVESVRRAKYRITARVGKLPTLT
ncbi:MAG: hypothetical protein ACP5U2_17550, partial [Bryobacteraceae bacterium]